MAGGMDSLILALDTELPVLLEVAVGDDVSAYGLLSPAAYR
jgi:hypothetical protein